MVAGWAFVPAQGRHMAVRYLMLYLLFQIAEEGRKLDPLKLGEEGILPAFVYRKKAAIGMGEGAGGKQGGAWIVKNGRSLYSELQVKSSWG